MANLRQRFGCTCLWHDDFHLIYYLLTTIGAQLLLDESTLTDDHAKLGALKVVVRQPSRRCAGFRSTRRRGNGGDERHHDSDLFDVSGAADQKSSPRTAQFVVLSHRRVRRLCLRYG